MKFKEKKREFYYWMGGIHALGFIIVALIIVAALAQILWLLPYAVIVMGLIAVGVLPLPGRKAMLRTVKGWLGINVIGMKIDALAKYLKVNFMHIPEHYECQKILKRSK